MNRLFVLVLALFVCMKLPAESATCPTGYKANPILGLGPPPSNSAWMGMEKWRTYESPVNSGVWIQTASGLCGMPTQGFNMSHLVGGPIPVVDPTTGMYQTTGAQYKAAVEFATACAAFTGRPFPVSNWTNAIQSAVPVTSWRSVICCLPIPNTTGTSPTQSSGPIPGAWPP